MRINVDNMDDNGNTIRILRILVITSLFIYYFPLAAMVVAGISSDLFFQKTEMTSFAANLCTAFDAFVKPLLRVLLGGLLGVFAMRIQERGQFIGYATLPSIIVVTAGLVALTLHGLISNARQPILLTLYSGAFDSLLNSARAYAIESMAYLLTLFGFGFVAHDLGKPESHISMPTSAPSRDNPSSDTPGL